MPTVIIDPGHGGMDPGAVYQGRQEKDDNLRLALAVGELLTEQGVDVLYTRTEDVYDSPYQKAVIANESGADYLISLHRNASPSAGSASGIQTLVYADRGVPAQMARDINNELVSLGFRDLGVVERPGLAVLRRSRMPAVLVEAGFIDNEADNQKFDEEFDDIAAAIANGILETLRSENSTDVRSENFQTDDSLYTGNQRSMTSFFEGSQDGLFRSIPVVSPVSEKPDSRQKEASPRQTAPDSSRSSERMPDQPGSGRLQTPGTMPNRPGSGRPQTPGTMPNRPGQTNPSRPAQPAPDSSQPPKLYRVQVGAFRNRSYAYELNEQLTEEGFPAFILMDGDWYKVQVGAFSRLENAIRMEYRLRAAGYDTYITT